MRIILDELAYTDLTAAIDEGCQLITVYLSLPSCRKLVRLNAVRKMTR
jgi:hypothetical protein